MTKYEFIRELESLLFDVPMEERVEAIQYYEDYFEDAGSDQEQNIIAKLGSPVKVAASIKAELQNLEAKNSAKFTERGYDEIIDNEPVYEIAEGVVIDKKTHGNTDDLGSWKQTQYNQNYSSSQNEYNRRQADRNQYDREQYNREPYNREKRKNNGMNIILIIVLAILAVPIGIPVIATVFALFLSISLVIGLLWISFFVVSLVLTFVGIGFTVFGVIKLLTIPIIGITFSGTGLLLFGIGLLFTVATVEISTKVMPVLINGFVNFCKIPFRKRRAVV